MTHLDFGECRCSRQHTCQWCLKHRAAILGGDSQ